MFSLNQLIEFNENNGTDCDSSDGTLDENVSQLNDRYLSLTVSNGKLGSALYDCNSHSIQVTEDLQLINDWHLVKALLFQLEPNHIIVSNKCDPTLLHLLKRFAINFDHNLDNNVMKSHILVSTNETTTQTTIQSDNISNNGSNNYLNNGSDNARTQRQRGETPQTSAEETVEKSSESDLNEDSMLWHFDGNFELHLMSQKCFSFEHSKNRILSLKVFNTISCNDESESFSFNSSVIHFSQINTIRSLGALLNFLETNRIGIENNGSNVEISDISLLYLEELVSIDQNSYECLRIFHNEWHPSVYKQGIIKKEGLSLYGIFNTCVSKLGANYMRKVFLRPTQDIHIINDRLNGIEFFTQTNNFVLRDNLVEHLKQIKNVNPLFHRLKTSILNVNDLRAVYKTLMSALLIRNTIANQNVSLAIFDNIKQRFTANLDHLVTLLNKIVDFEESLKTQRFQVNDGVDNELDSAKHTFNRLPNILNESAEQELIDFREIFRECNCVYIPQIGFLTSAPIDENKVYDSYEDEYGLEFAFKAADRAYYKSKRIRQLDNHYGDIQSEIYDRHIQVLSQLQELILKNKHLFDCIMNCCAKLDCLIAMSQTAIHYNYSRPNVTRNGIIEIIDGRHPLLELVSQSFVPNDTYSGGQYKKVKIISGPNACGKSAYLKQVCLIVYLAHIGSFVPAVKADITVIDRMFTRINSTESLSIRLSTFMLDLNQMANATNYTTNRSLVVIDEFGKGTQPLDGIALMAASLKHWFSKDTPHLFVSTHFHSLTALLDTNYIYECQTFEFMRDENEIINLYKLVTGVISESIASHIALSAGLPINIVERGLQVCQLMSTNQTINRIHCQELDDKLNKYIQMASKLIQIDIDSDHEVNQFLQFVSQFESKNENEM